MAPQCRERKGLFLAVQFILDVGRLDDATIDEGSVKPTHMIAALRTRPLGPVNCWKNWTPEFCVRDPSPVDDAVA